MHIIAFYNLKGGVGKTASAVNIAYLAAQSGLRTLLWDLDPQGAASWYLAADDTRTYKSKKLLKGKVTAADLAIVERALGTGGSRMDLNGNGVVDGNDVARMNTILSTKE